MKTSMKATIAAVCGAFASTAFAGLLYEPDNYAAQDHLVLQLDGIRNVGALKAHDSSATTWTDLASSRTAAIRAISSISGRSVPATSLQDGTAGWMDDGFYFDGVTFMQMSGALTLGNAYTIQVVCDVDTDKFQTRFSQATGAVSEGNLQWPGFVGTTDTDGNDYCNIYYNCGSGQQRVNAKMGNGNFDVFVNKATWNNHYLTAWASGSQASLFDGAAVGTKTSKNLSIGTRTLTFGASYGSTTYGAWRRSLVGTIKAIRIYDAALSDADLAANRALDAARFFGGIPVTNVVVASSIAGLEGTESSGAYAVDSEGHSFSAPAQATLNGKVYDCTGYTLETWNGSAWGDPVAHDGDLSCAATAASLVKITWQWAEAEFVPTDYTWMASPAIAAWDTSSANWNSGEAWADGNNAVFGASSQTTVTIASERLVNDLTINDVKYTFNGTGPLRVAGTITPAGAKDQNFNVPLASGRDDGSLHFYATGADWRSAYLNSLNNAQTENRAGRNGVPHGQGRRLLRARPRRTGGEHRDRKRQPHDLRQRRVFHPPQPHGQTRVRDRPVDGFQQSVHVPRADRRRTGRRLRIQPGHNRQNPQQLERTHHVRSGRRAHERIRAAFHRYAPPQARKRRDHRHRPSH